MANFEYRQAQEICDVFARNAARYLFIGTFGLIFAPHGIERFEDAWRNRVEVEHFPVCHPDDIIASKVAANRVKDYESLSRLREF